MRKYFIVPFLLVGLIACENSSKEESVEEKARRIHENVLTIDTHCDIDLANFTDDHNYSTDVDAQVTLPKMEKGGLDVAWLIVYTGQKELNEEGYAKAYQAAKDKFNGIHRLVNDYAPDRIELALTSEDVRRIHKNGKKVAMIGVENGYPVGEDLSRIKEFYDQGARYMSLAHNGHSQLADSNTGEEDDVWLHNGLSELGKQALAELNKYGIMADVSHPSKEVMRNMIALSKAPIIASHSSARALCDHSRNLDDEQLGWLKENGGVVQVVAFPRYLHTEKAEKMEELVKEEYKKQAEEAGFTVLSVEERKLLSSDERKEYNAQWKEIRETAEKSGRIDSLYANSDPVNVADLVDHIDYIVDKIGIEHVGISSDFDGGGGIYGWNDASETFNVTLELVKRGYSEDDIKLLWGENLLRVMDEVQALAEN